MVSPTQFAWIISLAHTSHLVPHGKKSIGHISVPLARWDARKRKRGWQTALQDAGPIALEQACVERAIGLCAAVVTPCNYYFHNMQTWGCPKNRTAPGHFLHQYYCFIGSL